MIVLMAIIIPSAVIIRRNSRNDARRAMLLDVQAALEQYYVKYKHYPSTCNAVRTTSPDSRWDSKCNDTTGNPRSAAGVGPAQRFCRTANPGDLVCTNAYTHLLTFYSNSPSSNPLAFANQPNNTEFPGYSDNWIPGMVSKGIMTALPVDPRGAGAVFDGSETNCGIGQPVRFTYKSSGYHYKLTLQCGFEGPISKLGDMADPKYPNVRFMAVYSKRLDEGKFSCSTIQGTDSNLSVPACW
jgi:Tfp pilus assembly protein PilE